MRKLALLAVLTLALPLPAAQIPAPVVPSPEDQVICAMDPCEECLAYALDAEQCWWVCNGWGNP